MLNVSHELVRMHWVELVTGLKQSLGFLEGILSLRKLRARLEINERCMLVKIKRSLHEIDLFEVFGRHSLRILTIADFRTIIHAIFGTGRFIEISNEIRIGPFYSKFLLPGCYV